MNNKYSLGRWWKDREPKTQTDSNRDQNPHNDLSLLFLFLNNGIIRLHQNPGQCAWFLIGESCSWAAHLMCKCQSWRVWEMNYGIQIIMEARGHGVKTHYFVVWATDLEGFIDLPKVTKQMDGRDRARIQIFQLLGQDFFCWAPWCLSSTEVNLVIHLERAWLTLLMFMGIGPPTFPSNCSTHIYRTNIICQACARLVPEALNLVKLIKT